MGTDNSRPESVIGLLSKMEGDLEKMRLKIIAEEPFISNSNAEALAAMMCSAVAVEEISRRNAEVTSSNTWGNE